MRTAPNTSKRYWKNVQFLNVKPFGPLSNHWALKK